MSNPTGQLIEPHWQVPETVRALCSTRRVDAGFPLLQAPLEGARCRHIRQVHGVAVVDAADGPDGVEADACFSRRPLLACRVVTADCLPVLICNRAGTEVAAVHAGWRGLAAGVIENCVAQLLSAPAELRVWLGPAISQRAFEVGEEVLDSFVASAPPALRDAVRTQFRAGAPGRYFADLYGLARQRLQNLGVSSISGGEYCTYSQPELFHSYRRDGSVERMISVIVFR